MPKGARDVLVFDETLPGFFLRIFGKSGKVTFGVKYPVAGEQRRVSLGPVLPKVLAERRKQAGDIIAKARLGQDVQAEKRAAAEKAAAARRRVTLAHTVSRYLADRKGELRAKSAGEYRRYLERYWQPLHDRALNSITRADVVGVVDDLAQNSGRATADRARGALSALSAWAIDRGYCHATPVLHIRARDQGGGRSRVLGEAELAEVWRACRDDDYGRIVRLLILTGQRKTEIGDLAWAEIVDFDKRQLALPPERTKNKRAHLVPLADGALAILAAILAIAGRDLVFGRGAGGFSGWSKAKAELDARHRRRQGPGAATSPHAAMGSARPAPIVRDARERAQVRLRRTWSRRSSTRSFGAPRRRGRGLQQGAVRGRAPPGARSVGRARRGAGGQGRTSNVVPLRARDAHG